jgi:hypothetical protein
MSLKTPVIVAIFAVSACLIPSVASADGLSSIQIQSIIGLLQAFNVDSAIVAQVQQILSGSSSSFSSISSSSTLPAPAPHVIPAGSAYTSSNIGYDLSSHTYNYPQLPFNFGVVGVTGGKAFVHNSRITSEYSWAQFGNTQPTMYMNLNAPYGSTVAGHISAPKSCPPAPVNSTSTEPTACEGYNYGYNAAADALAYAKSSNVASSFWWLDIEEANSWSDDTSVNDATIQGAIDYLNMQNIHVGIYSATSMWSDIAGEGFTPTQTINGATVSTPTWFPIGIANLIQAANTCVTGTSFIPNSPIWLLQYEANSTAVDQNYACLFLK